MTERTARRITISSGVFCLGVGMLWTPLVTGWGIAAAVFAMVVGAWLLLEARTW